MTSTTGAISGAASAFTGARAAASTSSASGVTGYETPTSTSTGASNELGKDAFLKLLVAQLKYQDPSEPTDASKFLSETAQFTLVEKFETLAAVTSQLVSLSRASSAVALVGRTVSWMDANGATKTGAVTAVSVAGGQTVLEVGSTTISLDSVIRVESGSSASGSSPAGSKPAGSSAAGSSPAGATTPESSPAGASASGTTTPGSPTAGQPITAA